MQIPLPFLASLALTFAPVFTTPVSGEDESATLQKGKRQQGVGAAFVPLTLTAKAPGAPFDGQKINANNQLFVIGAPTSSLCPFASTQPHLCPPGVETVIKVGNNEGDMHARLPGGQPIYISTTTQWLNLSFSQPRRRPFRNQADFTGFSFTPYPNTANKTTVYRPPTADAAGVVQGGSGYDSGTKGWLMWYSVPTWLACPAAGWYYPLAAQGGGAWNGTATGGAKNMTSVAGEGVWNVVANIPTRPLKEEFKKRCHPMQVEGTVWGGDVGAWEYVKGKRDSAS